MSIERLKAKIKANPGYRWQSELEVALAAELGLKIDVNQATVDDWLKLPGISIRQAQLLVELTGMGVQLLCLEDLAGALSVSIAQVKIWEPVLLFCYYDNISDTNPVKLNPNRASVAQLEQIPVISADLAANIVNNRQQQGRYANLVELARRLELEPELIAELMLYLRFN